MTQYLFLLRSDGVDVGAMEPESKRALFERFVVWTKQLKSEGILRGVESLMDGGGSTVRRKRDVMVVDGPYAEMKELVTGLFIVEAASREEAERLAGECPIVGIGGAVEVREIAPFPVRP